MFRKQISSETVKGGETTLPWRTCARDQRGEQEEAGWCKRSVKQEEEGGMNDDKCDGVNL